MIGCAWIEHIVLRVPKESCNMVYLIWLHFEMGSFVITPLLFCLIADNWHDTHLRVHSYGYSRPSLVQV